MDKKTCFIDFIQHSLIDAIKCNNNDMTINLSEVILYFDDTAYDTYRQKYIFPLRSSNTDNILHLAIDTNNVNIFKTIIDLVFYKNRQIKKGFFITYNYLDFYNLLDYAKAYECDKITDFIISYFPNDANYNKYFETKKDYLKNSLSIAKTNNNEELKKILEEELNKL